MFLLKFLTALHGYSSLLHSLLCWCQLTCSATYSTIADSLRRDLTQHSFLISKLKLQILSSLAIDRQIFKVAPRKSKIIIV